MAGMRVTLDSGTIRDKERGRGHFEIFIESAGTSSGRDSTELPRSLDIRSSTKVSSCAFLRATRAVTQCKVALNCVFQTNSSVSHFGGNGEGENSVRSPSAAPGWSVSSLNVCLCIFARHMFALSCHLRISSESSLSLSRPFGNAAQN